MQIGLQTLSKTFSLPVSQPYKKEVRECLWVTTVKPVDYCELWLLSSCSGQSIWWINLCEVQPGWCNLFIYTAFSNPWTELLTNCIDKPSSGISDQIPVPQRAKSVTEMRKKSADVCCNCLQASCVACPWMMHDCVWQYSPEGSFHNTNMADVKSLSKHVKEKKNQ